MYNQKGQIIILAVIFMAILLTASASLVGYTVLNVYGGRQSYAQNQALYIAEAGLEKAIYELNENPNYTGESNVALGNGVFTTSISTVDQNSKTITSTSYIPNSASPTATKTIKMQVIIDATQVSFNFGIQVGNGGLTTANESGVIGNVFSNGNVSGGGNITGSLTVAAGTTAHSDQEWTTNNGDFSFGDINSRKDVAQGFKPAPGGDVRYVSFYLKKVGSPGDLSLQLVADDAGEPSKTPLASGSISASFITGTYGWIDGYFSGNSNLSPGQPYWIILSAPSVSGSDYFVIAKDSADNYARGTAKYSDNWDTGNPDWTETNSDFNFKTFMGGVANSLSGNMTVSGDVRSEEITDCLEIGNNAYFQSLDYDCDVNGTEYPGTLPEAPQAMPVSSAQLAEWEANAEAGGVISGPYTINGIQDLGTVKIDGDLTIGLGATLNITGPIWVKGNIIFSNNSFLKIDSSLGSNGVALIADNPDNLSSSGLITVSNNMAVIGNGSPGSYAMVLSTNSSSNAIELNNNSSGVIFYAANGTIQVSNNAGATQLTGYGIHLNNNATITYSSGLASAGFSNGPGGSWVYLPGSYVVIK